MEGAICNNANMIMIRIETQKMNDAIRRTNKLQESLINLRLFHLIMIDDITELCSVWILLSSGAKGETGHAELIETGRGEHRHWLIPKRHRLWKELRRRHSAAQCCKIRHL